LIIGVVNINLKNLEEVKNMNVAIIMARKGSSQIKDKNMYMINGKPLVGYAIDSAHNAKRVDRVYVSTDCPKIIEYSLNHDCFIIDRPKDLRDDIGDAIQHAVLRVDNRYLKNVVILLGNTVMCDSSLVDNAMWHLETKPDIDSVMSIWEAGDDHPFRALEIKDGYIQSYGKKTQVVPINRQDYPRVFFYDQGIWAFRKDCVKSRDGPRPWWWMGKRCLPVIRLWVTGRDIHSSLDIEIAQWWVNK